MPNFKENPDGMKPSGFRMKGSPMKRNFGIGTSPAKQIGGDAGEAVEHWKKYQATKRNVSTSRPPTNNPKYKPSKVRVAGPGTRKLSVKAAKKVAKIGKFVRGSSLVGAAYELFKGWGKGHMKKGYSKPPTAGKI